MRNYLLFILGLCLLASCREGEIIETNSTTVEHGELDGAFYQGTIQSGNIPIVGAEINVYQSGELIGTTQSDTEGHYTTIDLNLKVGPEVTFEVLFDGYNQKVRRVESNQQVYNDLNLKLYSQSENLLSSELAFPGDTTLVKIYGTFTDENGQGIQGATCRSVWDIIEVVPGVQWTSNGGYERTDENGYFEMLVEQNKNIYFQSHLYAMDCTTILTEGDVLPGLPSSILWNDFMDLGILNQSTEILEKEDIESDIFKSEIQGRFLDCEGSPFTGGSIEIVIYTAFTGWSQNPFRRNKRTRLFPKRYESLQYIG